MKRSFLAIMLVVAIGIIPLLALANTTPTVSGLPGIAKYLSETGGGALGSRYVSGVDANSDMFAYVVGMILRAVLSFLGIAFFGLMVYGGFLWTNARGREEEVDKAKDTIIYSIIGLGIVLAAFAISYAVSWLYYSQVIPDSNINVPG